MLFSNGGVIRHATLRQAQVKVLSKIEKNTLE